MDVTLLARSDKLLGQLTHSVNVAVGCQTVTTEDTYDVVVLGAGPVGQNAAERARAAGLSVAMVERELVGGEMFLLGMRAQQGAAAPGHRRCRCRARRRCARGGQRFDQCRRCLRSPEPLRE